MFYSCFRVFLGVPEAWFEVWGVGLFKLIHRLNAEFSGFSTDRSFFSTGRKCNSYSGCWKAFSTGRGFSLPVERTTGKIFLPLSTGRRFSLPVERAYRQKIILLLHFDWSNWDIFSS